MTSYNNLLINLWKIWLDLKRMISESLVSPSFSAEILLGKLFLSVDIANFIEFLTVSLIRSLERKTFVELTNSEYIKVRSEYLFRIPISLGLK